jgi:hypothetical protein
MVPEIEALAACANAGATDAMISAGRSRAIFSMGENLQASL